MNDDQNQTISAEELAVDAELHELLVESEKLHEEIFSVGEEATKKIQEIGKDVDTTLNELEQLYKDLDEIEAKSADDFDQLVITEAEDLADDAEDE